ncbi:MAG: hypothetical protein A4E65_00254 [Syntrophorhabdus sp. PtaU1.Bin153]|nr:MAG: hypothetical protein A4E65_00254 [Syntrophorhabdus sp. PtaU1.Bin153]
MEMGNVGRGRMGFLFLVVMIILGIAASIFDLFKSKEIKIDARRSPSVFENRPQRPPKDLNRREMQYVADAIIQRMGSGNLAFNAPKIMHIDEKRTVELLLSAVASIDELKSQLRAEGEKMGASIKISDQMEARLSGQNFSILAITPETQAVSGKENTEWKWEVSAKEAGKQTLHLTLSAFIGINGKPTPRVFRSFDVNIEVQVSPVERITRFVRDNWQWLWVTVLAPLCGWLWKSRKKKGIV